MVEGHVPQGVEVQVLSSAHVTKNPRKRGFFILDKETLRSSLPTDPAY